MTHTYSDIPLPPTPFGRRAYRAGRRLVADRGLRLSQIVWDADEVLWDWVMDVGELVRQLPRSLVERDAGHREYYRRKPGMFELIWGMRHASLEGGHDPDVRIWTNGYPWRLWRIAREIPGFTELVGPPAGLDADGRTGFANHPRIFYRGDYVEAADRLLGGDRPGDWSDAAGEALERQFERDPFDTSFKLPELAQLCDKPGFGGSEIIVDDHRSNVERFAASGRHGVHVFQETPRVGWGRVPNVAWRKPQRVLAEMKSAVAGAVAEGLARLAGRRVSTIWTARARRPSRPSHDRTFVIDVPDERLREEWLEPVRRLREAHELP